MKIKRENATWKEERNKRLQAKPGRLTLVFLPFACRLFTLVAIFTRARVCRPNCTVGLFQTNFDRVRSATSCICHPIKKALASKNSHEVLLDTTPTQ